MISNKWNKFNVTINFSQNAYIINLVNVPGNMTIVRVNQFAEGRADFLLIRIMVDQSEETT